MEIELANLVLSLATSDDGGSTNSLSRFVKDVVIRSPSSSSLVHAITTHSQGLVAEESELLQSLERTKVGRDKLTAELHRIEASIQQAEKRRQEITEGKRYCRAAINAIASGNSKIDSLHRAPTAPAGGMLVSHSVELPDHLNAIPVINFSMDIPRPAVATIANQKHDVDIEGIVGLLSMRDINENTLQQALSNLEIGVQHAFDSEITVQEADSLERLVEALLCHVPLPRPPIQQMELRILSHIFKRCVARSAPRGARLMCEDQQESMIDVIVRLLTSVNDDVKSEALDSLSHVIASEPNRQRFARAGGVEPLISIVGSSTNEAVLERALILMWMLLSSSDTLRSEVREHGGLRAALDLLYTDSMPILENVAMSIGYITREENSKVAIREGGGLEKIVATLRHPSESIQTKIAGAVWNCASNTENRVTLRQLGCIPALIELLQQPHEHVQENAAGALWNLSVDTENKTQILDYGGILALIKMLQGTKSSSVIENVTGTLWNCSAMLENRAAIRKCGGIVPLVSFLRSGNDKTQDNCAGALRNCAINDQNKTAIREAGGVELVFELLPTVQQSTQDKLVAMLWILTAATEVKNSVRLCGGLSQLVQLLDDAQLQTQEKVIGVLRNCATEPANRLPLIELKVVAQLVHSIEVNFDRISATAKEAAASAVWYLCRDDKLTARREGGLRLMCRLLYDASTAVVEHAAGALSSLTITVQENRDAVREEGGLHKLLELVVSNFEVCTAPPGQQAAGQPSSFAYALLNCLLSIRNATSSNDANMKIAASFPELSQAFAVIVGKGADEFAKEAALCIKNLSLDRQFIDDFSARGGTSALTSLSERGSSEAVRKAAAMALQSVTRYSGAARR
jgi:hypothetical protein